MIRNEVSDRIQLWPVEKADLQTLYNYRNDPSIYERCRQYKRLSIEEHESWFKRIHSDPSINMFSIMLGMKVVGCCGLTSIDMVNRRAEFSLYIGPPYKGMGLAKQALHALLDYGFDTLGLNRIWGEVFDWNPAMTLFEKMGFTQEGTRREFYFRDGKFIDAHLISIKKEDICYWPD